MARTPNDVKVNVLYTTQEDPAAVPKWFKRAAKTFLYAVVAGVVVGLGLSLVSVTLWVLAASTAWMWR